MAFATATSRGSTNPVSVESEFQFYRLWPGAPEPRPADPSVVGALSLRAVQHCEPIVAASGLGWYLYPPIDFDLTFDGHRSMWRAAGQDNWLPLTVVPALPVQEGLTKRMGAEAGPVPSFLSNAPEHGIVQIWCGSVVRSPPGWWSLVRPLVNYPRDHLFEVLEGIIETDWWTGPLLSPIRMVKTDQTVELRRHRPFALLQPVRREATIISLGAMSLDNAPEEILAEFLTFSRAAAAPDRKQGSYRRAARAHRKGERS